MQIINKYSKDVLATIKSDENLSLKEAIKKVGYYIRRDALWEPDVMIDETTLCYSDDLQLVGDNYDARPVLPWKINGYVKSGKISNVCKAVDDYNRSNGHGPQSSFYGTLMFDRATGEVWADEFVNKTSYRIYNDDDIINLGYIINRHGFKVTDNSVEYYATKYLKIHETDVDVIDKDSTKAEKNNA